VAEPAAARGCGGTAAAVGGGLAPTMVAEPGVEVRVQDLGGFIGGGCR
jgi:hypothetical protein